MRDLILQLSKSSIYSTKPSRSCSYAALHRHILEGGHFNDKPLYIILSPSIKSANNELAQQRICMIKVV
ncbi:transcriptional regulator [Klebsiella pneumoniae]|nr:transcriptional regulator [Klebsiella pneumoniae]